MAYFIKFDNGTDAHNLTIQADSAPDASWYEISEDPTGKFYKLVNNTPAIHTDADTATYLAGLQSSSGYANIRVQRDMRLKASDWTQYEDVPTDTVDKAAWATYRQALRDLPANTPDPTKVVWPTPPTK